MSQTRANFLKHIAQTSPFPMMLDVAKAKGVYIFDHQGKKYFDMISGIAVSSLGHCHPKVVQAVQQQAATYMHTMVYGEYLQGPQIDLAQLLAANLPDTLNSTYFVNSGTEAVEGAMKLAKRYTGKSKFIACKNAYHGSTQGAASLMSDPTWTRPFRPLLPDIHHIAFNCEFCLKKIDASTAAVIIETVQGEWGVRKPKNGFLKKLRERCTEVGALLIFDEIQAGMGRTGSLFAFEQYDVVPDVLLLAKGLGGGMPIGAFIADQKVMECFTDNPILGHITTFGGHPVSCAAALATLKELTITDIISKVESKSDLIISLLKDHSFVLDIRNAGLMMAVELASFEQVQQVINYCLENGVVVDWFLFNDRSLRIAPPLVINETEIREACGVILRGLDMLEERV